MDYSVVEKIRISKNAKKVGAFLYDPEIDGIYLDVPWWFPVQLGVTHNLTRCEVTPMFLRLPFLMRGWTNHEILLRQIELLHLAQEGKILMHASCVQDFSEYFSVDPKGMLIVGFPNSGKTYQTYKWVSEGRRLISEEYTIINRKDGAWLAAPYKPVMRTCFSKKTMDHCGLKRTFRENL